MKRITIRKSQEQCLNDSVIFKKIIKTQLIFFIGSNYMVCSNHRYLVSDSSIIALRRNVRLGFFEKSDCICMNLSIQNRIVIILLGNEI